MKSEPFPVIDLAATGKNIVSLRCKRGLTVHDLQEFFGFEKPQAIYKWQHGDSLPSVDNLFALSVLLGVSMDDILVRKPTAYQASDSSLPDSREGVFLLVASLRFPSVHAVKPQLLSVSALQGFNKLRYDFFPYSDAFPVHPY